jgi:hypothetical protein
MFTLWNPSVWRQNDEEDADGAGGRFDDHLCQRLWLLQLLISQTTTGCQRVPARTRVRSMRHGPARNLRLRPNDNHVRPGEPCRHADLVKSEFAATGCASIARIARVVGATQRRKIDDWENTQTSACDRNS